MAPRPWKHYKKGKEDEYFSIKLKHGLELRVAHGKYRDWFGRLLMASKFQYSDVPGVSPRHVWGTVAETKGDDDVDRVKQTLLLLAQRVLRESVNYLEEGDGLLPPKKCTHPGGKALCSACLYRAIQAIA